MTTTLVWVPLKRCVLRFQRGEIRRSMFPESQPFICFTLACPMCGARMTLTEARAGGFTSGPWEETPYEQRLDDDDDNPREVVLVRHPGALTAAKPVICHGCKRTFEIDGGVYKFGLAAAEPAA